MPETRRSQEFFPGRNQDSEYVFYEAGFLKGVGGVFKAAHRHTLTAGEESQAGRAPLPTHGVDTRLLTGRQAGILQKEPSGRRFP